MSSRGKTLWIRYRDIDGTWRTRARAIRAATRKRRRRRSPKSRRRSACRTPAATASGTMMTMLVLTIAKPREQRAVILGWVGVDRRQRDHGPVQRPVVPVVFDEQIDAAELLPMESVAENTVLHHRDADSTVACVDDARPTTTSSRGTRRANSGLHRSSKPMGETAPACCVPRCSHTGSRGRGFSRQTPEREPAPAGRALRGCRPRCRGRRGRARRLEPPARR